MVDKTDRQTDREAAGGTRTANATNLGVLCLRQTGRNTDRQTDHQHHHLSVCLSVCLDRQTDRQTGRQTDDGAGAGGSRLTFGLTVPEGEGGLVLGHEASSAEEAEHPASLGLVAPQGAGLARPEAVH